MPLDDLALQLYSIRRETAADAQAGLRQVPGMGYNAVETAGDYGWSASQWKELLHELDLKIVGAHLGIEKFEGDDLAKTLEFQREVGNSRLIIPWIGQEYRSLEGWSRLGTKLNELGAKVHAEGFTLYYHNHDFEITPVEGGDGKGGLELLMEATDPALVNFEVDTYWVEKGGRDAADFVETYIERIGMIHAKELRRSDGSDVPAGQGDIDFRRIIDLAIDRGTPVVVEFEGENAVPAVTEAATYLRSL